MESRQYTAVNAEPIEDTATESLFQKRRCCLCFTWSTTSSKTRLNSFWAGGINAFKKLREWSEIVAGPRWKTFIRRFNRGSSSSSSIIGSKRTSNYQYDPLSYALNFDEGPGQNGDFSENEDYGLRNFSVRYASIPASAKASMDLGRDGPSFV